jgi:hypothetical protein
MPRQGSALILQAAFSVAKGVRAKIAAANAPVEHSDDGKVEEKRHENLFEAHSSKLIGSSFIALLMARA